jgi:hypothetical protein
VLDFLCAHDLTRLVSPALFGLGPSRPGRDSSRFSRVGVYADLCRGCRVRGMPLTPSERAEITARLREVHAELAALEAKVDIEAWKKLFHEKQRLERRLESDDAGTKK